MTPLGLKRRARRIHTILDQLYPKVDPPLDHHDPFSLLMAVLLSAQTTDKKVNEVTPGLFAMAPNPEALASLEVEQVLQQIRPLGLAPQKARNLVRLGQQLCERHQGQVPADLESLENLAGVGHKTASVVIAQAFGQPAFPVDTHIHRLAWRWGLSAARNVAETERDLKGLFPQSSWNRLHLQIIFFGREHCPARGHLPQNCPICSWAFSGSRQKEENSRARA